MSERLRILVVEDSERDAELILREVKKGGYAPEFERVESAEAMSHALGDREWDVVISDHTLPGFGSLQALTLAHDAGLDLPFIIVSGTIDPQTAVGAMRLGAHDFVMKDDMVRLVPAIRRELKEAAVRRSGKASLVQIHKSETRLRALMENVTDSIVTIDAAGRIESANPAAEKLFGRSEESIGGRPFVDLLAQPDREWLRRYLGIDQRADEQLASGDGERVDLVREMVGLRSDGWLVPIEVALSEMRVEGERLLIATIRDIAERKRAEQEADRLKDEFIALTSHELRTPLTSIIGYMELMRQRMPGDADEEYREFVDVVDRNSKRLLRLVGQVLFVAQLREGGMWLRPTEMNLHDIVADCLREAQPLASSSGVELRSDLARVPETAGDEDRLFQLIYNLLTNAIKFSADGTPVDVRLKPEQGKIVLEVQNGGIGIDADELPRIYDRFYRGNAAVRNETPGVGLGLTIAKAIADAHGGRVSVTSEAGRGTTARLELPL